MIPASCKRLIEVDFPIAKVSEFSAKEKSIRHGHPSTLHLWWARRPLAACRSVLLGLLLPDPCDKDCPPDFASMAWDILARRFPTSGNSKEALREALLNFIGEFANWDLASDPMFLGIARDLVKAAHPEETPVVVDPFSGGGAIPLEALRLGCEAFASDLNPVACLILKTLLEDIPRYGNADFTLKDEHDKKAVIHGLADALRHAGRLIKTQAEKELSKFYPADPDGSRPIAYLWARTVLCEAVGCGAEIPLVRSFWLSKKADRKCALRYSIVRSKRKPPHLAFEVFSPTSASDVPVASIDNGKATCPHCHNVLSADRVRAQLVEQRGGANIRLNSKSDRCGGATLLAVATLRTASQGRHYRIAAKEDYASVAAAHVALQDIDSSWLPNEPLNPTRPSPNARGLSAVTRCGMNTFADLFTTRQQVALATIAKLIDAFPGRTAEEKALKRLLGACADKLADLSNVCCRWEPVAECPRQLFSRQAVPIVWDIAEGMPIGDSSGSFAIMIERQAYAIEQLRANWFPGQVLCADACASPLANEAAGIWFTDPPYYDSIPYADLSDFFYVWLKRALRGTDLLFANHAGDGLTPKTEECVWNQSHLVNGKPKDGSFFEKTVAKAFAVGRRILREDGVSCIVFAHKTTEGWEALLSGIQQAGLVITASWPISTEMATRMVARDTAALASSVHLVCRPRPANAGAGDWGEVKSAMEKRIREWLPTLQKHGIRGADAIFSCLGPALESYSRYDRVLTAADREVPLGGNPDATEPHERGFLSYVFETLSKEALREILGTADTEGFEEDARMTALVLWTLQSTKSTGKADAADEDDDAGTEDDDDDAKPSKKKDGFSMPFDTFIRITRPMGIHYPSMEGSIIKIDKGVVRLLPVRERSEALLGEVATRPGVDVTLEDVKQMEFTFLQKEKHEAALPTAKRCGRKGATPAQQQAEATFTTLDRLHRAMLLFTLGRSALLKQVLESEMRQSKRFERLALALNALYPDGSDERRMLEGVQAAMRGIH
jgi:adenine-specific DNA methylase